MGTSIGKVGFFGDAFQKLWCLSHIETLRYQSLSTESYYCTTVTGFLSFIFVQVDVVSQFLTGVACAVFGTGKMEEMKVISRMLVQ